MEMIPPPGRQDKQGERTHGAFNMDLSMGGSQNKMKRTRAIFGDGEIRTLPNNQIRCRKIPVF